MKILAIRIKNLASLEGATTIDFTQEPLCSAGIFAITGPTGSGKSTILDAICLALYAETPRYRNAESRIDIKDVQDSTIKQNDVRAILRDGMADGYAEVDFVGIDGQHYRANWSVRRARNRADGSLQQANTILKNLTTGSDIGGKKTELLPEIARLVGLNYDQFIRSVLLAQGDFTAFLKADKDQKASLLEKLTGTHIYSEISQKIFERHREENQQLRLLQQRQEGIIILTNEELGGLKEQEAVLADTLNRLDTLLDATKKEIKWHDDLTVHQIQVNEAQQTLAERLTEKARAAGRETYLKQVEQVQPTRTWMDALTDTAEQLSQRRQALGEARTRQQLLANQAAEAREDVDQAIKYLGDKVLAGEEAKPLLDRAKKLDVQLQAKETEVVAAQARLDIRKSKWEGSRQRLAKQQQQAGALEREIQVHQRWQEKNSSRQPVAENHTFIITRLTDASKQLEAIQKASVNVAQLETEIKVKAAELTGLNQQSESLGRQVTAIQQQLETLQNALSAISATQLREESKTLTAKLEELLIATTVWRTVHQTQCACHALADKEASARRELTAREARFTAAEAAFLVASEQRKASSALLERATIAASDNVESLRGQLTDGQPCPVCGSATHPYAHTNPQLNHVLEELKKAHDALEAIYQEQQATYLQLAQAIPLLQQSIQEIADALQVEQAKLELHTADWNAYSISKACVDIKPEDREHWLRNRAQSLMADQSLVSDQLDQFEKLQSDTEAVKQMLERLRNGHATVINAAKDVEREVQTRNERIAHARSEQSDGTARLTETIDLLQPHFPDNQWITNWKNQPNGFLKNVNEFANEWNKTSEASDRGRNQLKVVQATIAGLQAEEQTLAADATETAQDLGEKQVAYATLQQNRQSIFGGDATEIIETRLKQQITRAQEQLNARKHRQESLQAEKAGTDATIKETERQVAQMEKHMEELSRKINQWLTAYNTTQQCALDRNTLQSLLAHPAAWLGDERDALAAIERAVTQTASVLEERQRRLAQHEKQRPSDQLPDTLSGLVDTLQGKRSGAQRDYNEVGFRLKQDEASKRRLGDLLNITQAQHVVVENWSKLNDIIGSADGKKFRQVAQEYTLDVLLSYANEHLKVLSARYRLQRIPYTLGLQVLDQDMGDEVRTVYSLSGGESFLVSLALALGLASLSASRMQVESLFIDEGFGALDPNTLNIAMDALERLHNQGRKVGVISHVQEMTERIPVQIRVSKQQRGRSEVMLTAS